MKKNLGVILATIGITILLVAVYLIFFYQRQSEISESNPPKNEISTIVKAQPILEGKRFSSFRFSSAEHYLYAVREDESGIYKINLTDLNLEKIAEFDFIDQALWSPDFNQVIFEVAYDKERFEKYQSPFLVSDVVDGQIIYWLYNISDGKLRKLSSNIYQPRWAPDGKKILYIDIDPENETQSIKIIDLAQDKIQTIVASPKYDELTIGFISNQEIYYLAARDQTDTLGNNLYKVNLAELQTENIINDDSAGNVAVSPLGGYFSYEHYLAEGNYVLGIMNASGQNKKDFDLIASADSTAWSPDENWFFAVNQSENSNNEIYRLNLSNRRIDRLAADFSAEDIKIKQIIAIDSQTLLVVGDDDLLYKIALE